MRVIVVVGVGPRGVSVVERIAANLPAATPGPVELHLVDPHPPGPGRLWRLDQSPLLRMNSLAMDTTLFTDPSVTCAGPVRQGPSLAEWAASIGPGDVADAGLRTEAQHLAPMHFATRRLGGEYMRWCLERAIEAIGDRAAVVVHRATATAIDDLDGDRLRVSLDDGGAAIDADAVVLCLGHLDAQPSGEHAELIDHAARHELVYLPPEHASDADLDRFAPGADVIVRGFGLDFIDKMVLLAEGRGGRFDVREDGSYAYTASGREPVFHVGSRRGVPYRSKLDYELVGPVPRLPRFATADAIAALVAQHRPLLFGRHVWPILAKEIGWAAYHELFHGHPEHVSMPWAEFDAAMAACDWHSDEMRSLVARAIPDPADRIDFEAFDRPLERRWFDDDADLQRWIRDHIVADVTRRTDPRYSADLGAFVGFLSVFPAIAAVLGSPNLSARSRVEDFDRWFFGFFSYWCSGPPPRRLRELAALADAGLVTFVGSDMRVTWDADGFHARGANSPQVERASALIDARIPDPTVSRSASELLRRAAQSGHVVEHVLHDRGREGADDGDERFALGQVSVSSRTLRVVGPDGTERANLYAVGPHSTARAPIFARRGTNSVALRQNDALARAVLGLR